MRLLAINIEGLAQGNQAKMVSSGFDVAANGDSVLRWGRQPILK